MALQGTENFVILTYSTLRICLYPECYKIVYDSDTRHTNMYFHMMFSLYTSKTNTHISSHIMKYLVVLHNYTLLYELRYNSHKLHSSWKLRLDYQ